MRLDRLAHSILLYGRSQAALEALALEVATKLLEFEPRTDGEVITGYPDFLALRPSKKARQISAADTRELIRRIQHSPRVGDRKVAVVFEADRMNTSSANIFLKTLEEPPLDTTILLLTTRQYSLLSTIRSRCLRLRVTESLEPEADTSTLNWLETYRAWLDRLVDDTPTKEQVPELILGIYALVAELKAHLDRMTKEAMPGKRDPEFDAFTDDEKAALEARISISIRDQFLARIEEATSDFARVLAGQGRTTLAARLPAAITALEDNVRLLPLYFPVTHVVEQFLLASLRLWSAPE